MEEEQEEKQEGVRQLKLTSLKNNCVWAASQCVLQLKMDFLFHRDLALDADFFYAGADVAVEMDSAFVVCMGFYMCLDVL